MSTQWEKMLQEINNEYESDPNNFLRKKMISRTVHPNMQKLASKYYGELSHNDFFTRTMLPRLAQETVGNPFRFTELPKCSPTTIFQCLHFKLIKERMGIFIPQSDVNNIVEIGGGYGNLARLMRGFGYTGKYSIVDFPLMSRIQTDYLKAHNIHDVESVELSDNVLTPKEEKSMLIGTYSISEMPIETRRLIEPHYENFKYVFLAYNSSFDGDDNVKYFTELQEMMKPSFNIDYFKNNHNQHWFMLCERKY